MRHAALKKIDHFETREAGGLLQNNAPSAARAEAAAHRLKIVHEAEEASHLAGNLNGPDLGDFEEKYRLSGFA